MPKADALHDAGEFLDVEVAGCSNGNSTDMDSCFLASGDHGPDQIAGPETLDRLRPHQGAAREAIGGEPSPLVAAPACGFDDQGRQAPAGDSFDVADTQGVQGVGLGYLEPGPVPLGPTSAAGGHRQANGLEGIEQGPAGGIDGGGIFQGGLGQGQDALQPLLVLGEELLDRTGPLLLVAGFASQG